MGVSFRRFNNGQSRCEVAAEDLEEVLEVAQHLRVVGMPGEDVVGVPGVEKQMVEVAKEAEKEDKVKEMPREEKEKVEKEIKGKQSKEPEIEEKEEGEMFKSEEDEFDEVRIHKHLGQGQKNPLSDEEIKIPLLPHIASEHRLSQMSQRRSKKEKSLGALSAAERQRNWSLRMLQDPTTREVFMQRRRESAQRYRDRLSKEGWEEVKRRQREKKKEKYVAKKIQKMLENQL